MHRVSFRVRDRRVTMDIAAVAAGGEARDATLGEDWNDIQRLRIG